MRTEISSFTTQQTYSGKTEEFRKTSEKIEWSRFDAKELACNPHVNNVDFATGALMAGHSLSPLPTEILEYTLSFLSTKSILNFTSTSTYFRSRAIRYVPLGLKNEESKILPLFHHIVNIAKPAYSKAVSWFVKAGVDVNRHLFWTEHNLFYGNGLTPLSLATKEGCVKVVMTLLSHHADVNMANVDESIPLHWAALHGYTELVDLLIRTGSDINKSRKDGASPLFSAAVGGQTEIVKMLAKAGADMDKPMRNGATPFFGAVFFGHLSVLKMLLEWNADINKARINGATPISVAAEEGMGLVVEFLINAGADVSIERDDGLTPIQLAAGNGHTKIVDMLKQTERETFLRNNY